MENELVRDKQRVSNIVNKNINDIYSAIDSNIKTLKEVDKDIREQTDKYVKLVAECDSITAEIKKEKRDINQTRDALVKKEGTVTRNVLRLEKELDKLSSDIVLLRKNIITLQEKKATLDKESRVVDTLKGIKSGLEKDVKKLKGEFDKNSKSFEKSISDYKKEEVRLTKSISVLEDKHEKELAKVLPKMEALDLREKAIKQKEGDLSIIEARYKKLYADKGAGFKA